MNILFIHEVDWLNKVVFEIHNQAEALSLLGHNVYAIDYEDKWKRGGPAGQGSLKTREFDGVSRAYPGAKVMLIRPGFIWIPGLSRLSAGFTHYREIQRTIKEKNIDVIMLYSVPTNGLQALSIARKYGIPVVFRSIDILYRLVRFPILRSPTKIMERKVYAGADLILAITPNHMRYVTSLGADKSKVKLLPLPIDTRLFHDSVDSSEMRRKWDFSENDRIIVFIGTLFDFCGLDGMIRQFPKVLEAVPQAKLLIVGDGPQRPELERIISDMGLKEKVILTGFQPYQTMPQYISLAAVCINPFINNRATIDIFPGKIIQYLACGRATVATPLLGITAMVKDESGGIVYKNGPAEMSAEVINLLQSEEKRQRLGHAGLDYVRNNHDHQKIARQLESELLTLVNKSGKAAPK